VGTESDAPLFADVADALWRTYQQNPPGLMSEIENPYRVVTDAAESRPNLRTQSSLLLWLAANPWERSVTPQSAMSVRTFIAERLQRCTRDSLDEVEALFPLYPLARPSPSPGCANR
jgi:hypothetical protein